ncbi:acyltransferase family protein [Psychrobacillus psychrodurans]|uniref:acyltransferase family protein n=1 Tax=Psychrobacillus psychrodurans TaxID=126157 RepID=UPI003CFF2418
MMRGLAILLVILVHTAQRVEGDVLLRPFADYGQMGVQLFFIASAFTLCYSMDSRNSRNSSKFALRNFYIRRFFRIAPLYYFGIILYFIVTSINTTIWVSNKNPIDILLNIFLLNGLFETANNSVVPGGWSIGTEILFYLLFPLLFSIFIRLQRIFKYAYLVLPLCSLIFSLLIQRIFYILNSPEEFYNNSFFYYNITNQLPVFCIGIALYIAYSNELIPKFKKTTCIIFILLFSLISWYLMSNGQFMESSYIVIFPFISSISFVFIFILLQSYSVIKTNFFTRIGIVSYSSYIVHFVFTFYLTSNLSDLLGFIPSDIRLLIIYCIVVVLTYITSKMFHKYIELYGIKIGRKLISSLDNRVK